MEPNVGADSLPELGGLGEIDELRWVQHGERSLYENKWVRLTLADVTPPDGNRFEHHVVRLQRVVMVAVVDDIDRVLLLWRHRFVPDSWGWELPGGIAEAGESDDRTAIREVVEETGWKPLTLERLAEFQPMPGMVDSPHVIFTAYGAEHVGEPTDTEEASIVKWVPLTEVASLLSAGLIAGAGSIVGLLQLLASRTG
ncbi:NUDIX hydrolase [Cryobacterium sp. MDB2-33-2]|uniref:NUDIX hydrolase n=1 Tax=Cryobacterium sp. MDB2-33-2 TaxID=1259179 RepID=UPI001F5461BC|nr:NUDIX hydrolase [Cryobacterium sp. MDB2-33-2]